MRGDGGAFTGASKLLALHNWRCSWSTWLPMYLAGSNKLTLGRCSPNAPITGNRHIMALSILQVLSRATSGIDSISRKRETRSRRQVSVSLPVLHRHAQTAVLMNKHLLPSFGSCPAHGASFSCRKKDDKWIVAMNRWQDMTDMEVNKGMYALAQSSISPPINSLTHHHHICSPLVAALPISLRIIGIAFGSLQVRPSARAKGRARAELQLTDVTAFFFAFARTLAASF